MSDQYADEEHSSHAPPAGQEARGPNPRHYSGHSATGAERKVPRAEADAKARTPWWSPLRRLIALLVSVIGVVGAGITIWTFIPRHHSDIAFTNPVPGTISGEPCNITITGRGTAPAGQVIVVSHQEKGTGNDVDPNLYFATVHVDSGEWSAHEQLGTSSTTAGTPYTVTVWFMDGGWVSYLATLTNGTPAQNLWWSSHGLPPGAKKVQAVVVTRSAGKC